MTTIRCVGCGNTITGNIGVGRAWAYTCPCGSHLFTFDGKLSMPSSLLTYLAYKKYGTKSPLGVQESIPHIEYYIGYNSEYMDDIKRDVIEQLKLACSVSEEECQECMTKRNERMTSLRQALEEDDYWARLPDAQLAAHFRIPVVYVKELKNKLSQSKGAT